ncbi:hypothetical protein X275_01360 [Marinitoga sp. 1197]|uniref:hypothetical protein n=1 Tax=Marinitoga sp. 1197 TaxID=1428449 RepID=UPI000640E2C6|nr:hypothetical protein [Marinitoga sp. 1197]AJW76919.1 hypothetical protein UF08_30 [Marinitoga camini virus 1]KLO24063.1 hypothetical protein X275_01360 [Marinitoga sp. 1197]
MGFFIDNEKTEKIYFDEKLNISNKKTNFWVEIKSEPNFYLIEEIKKSIKPKTIKMNAATNEIELDTEKMGEIPLELLIKLIVNWSEDEKPTLQVLRTKTHPKFLQNLWNKLLELYEVGNDAFRT